MAGGFFDPAYSSAFGPVTKKLKSKFGWFTTPVGAGSTQLIDCGFDPKFVYFLQFSSIVTIPPVTEVNTSSSIHQGAGVATKGTDATLRQASASYMVINNQSTMIAGGWSRRDGIGLVATSGKTIIGITSVSAMGSGSNGFTVRNEVGYSAARMTFMFCALGGDALEDASMVEFNFDNISPPHTQDITGFGFDPTFVMGFGIGDGDVWPDAIARMRSTLLGFGFSSSDQGHVTGAHNDGVATSAAKSATGEGYETWMRLNTSGAENTRYEFDSFITDGVRLNALEEDDDRALLVGLKGADLAVTVRDLITQTTTATISHASLPGKTAMGMIFSTQEPEDPQEGHHADVTPKIGMFKDATDQGCIGFSARDAVSTSEVYRHLSGINIYRRVAAAGGTLFGRVKVSSVFDTVVNYNQDVADNAQNFGIAMYFAPLESPPDGDPTGLTANAIGPNRIDLNWTDNATNEAGYWIERESPIGGGFVVIAAVGKNVTSYIDLTVLPSTQYNYRVQAFNDDGVSAYSNEANATTPAGVPTVGKITSPTVLGRITRLRG